MTRGIGYLLALFILALVLAAPPSHAATFTVDSTADAVDANPGDGSCATAGAACTLRAAIGEANALAGADTVNIPAGTYQVTLFAPTEFVNASGSFDITEDLTIARTGAGTVTIDGNGFAGGERAFYVAQNLTVSFSGVRIINGNANDFAGIGGGIWVDQNSSVTVTNSVINSCNAGTDGGGIMVDTGASVTLSGVEVSENHSDGEGAGIYNNSGTLTIQNSSTIGGGGAAGNTSDSNGGGIYNNGGSVDVADSTITGNTSDHGGGIYNTGGTVTITSSTISDNDADDLIGGVWDGGGIYNIDGSLTITSSTFSGNASTRFGGAVYSRRQFAPAPLSITGSTFNGNSAAMHGGAILTEGASALTLTDSTLSGNTAVAQDGGGLYHDEGPSTITGCAISGNTAGDDGGGVINWGDLTVTNSTISGNTAADQGGGIQNQDVSLTLTGVTIVRNSGGQGGGIEHNGGTITVENTIIADNGAGLDCVIFDVFTDNGGNLDSDDSCSTFTQSAAMVQGTGFAALASNNGATQTHALLAGSPALDAAPDCGGLADDQRGIARPQNGTCDIGAFEARLLTVTVTKSGSGSVADTNTVTGFDISCGATCSDTVLENTSVTLTATPSGGYYFSGWSGGCSGTGNCALSSISANKAVTATFTAYPDDEPPAANTPPHYDGDWLVWPADGGSNIATSTGLIWKKLTDDEGDAISYETQLCSEFANGACVGEWTVAARVDSTMPRNALAGFGFGMAALAGFGLIRTRRGRAWMLALLIMAGGAAAASCGSSSSSTEETTPDSRSCDSMAADEGCQAVTGLSPETEYHWKVVAADSAGNQLESAVRAFTTGE